MGNKKITVLFVVNDFHQAGAPRLMYEISSSIDRTKFEVTFLCLQNLGIHPEWEDYYYAKHLELGSRVFFLSNLLPKWYPLFNKISRRIFRREVLIGTQRLHQFLNTFQYISFMGEYTYPPIKKLLPAGILDKSFIHILNARFQHLDLYKGFEKDKKYQFVSGFDTEEIDFELQEFSEYTHSFFPLAINIDTSSSTWAFSEKKKKKIGIFTRLNHDKPLDPFFAAFHILLQTYPEIELHIFGSGDPKKTGVARLASSLYITPRLFFRGHKKNIAETSLEEELDLVWYQGYNNKPAGFAGYDIASVGIPQLFWDFSGFNNTYHNEIYPQFRNLSAFCEKSAEILFAREHAEHLSRTQQEDVLTHRDIRKHIALLENLYTEKAERS